MASEEKIYDIAMTYLRRMLRKSDWPHATVGALHGPLAETFSVRDGERVLLSGFYSDESWYVFTTRRIVSRYNGQTRAVDPSRGVKSDFGNFKGYGPEKDNPMLPGFTMREPGVLPREVATITAANEGGTVQLEFVTWTEYQPPISATMYWEFKHPFIDKLMTSAERENYKRTVALPRKPRGRPAQPIKEIARQVATSYGRGAITNGELWNYLMDHATPKLSLNG